MQKDHLQHFVDLRRGDIDPEIFGAALAVEHIYTLIAHGGSEFGRPEWDTALQPNHIQAFLARAVETAQKTKRFEREWNDLQRIFPRMEEAWEKGQTLFQEALTRAETNQEDMEYLSQIDFAVDCYAYVSAMKMYSDNRALQAWIINGYMLAWRKHFLGEEEIIQKYLRGHNTTLFLMN